MKKLTYYKMMIISPILVWGVFSSFYLFSSYTIEETTAGGLYDLAISQRLLSIIIAVYVRDFSEFTTEADRMKSEELSELMDKINKIYPPLESNDIHPKRPLYKGKDMERFFIFRDDAQIYFVFTSKFRFFTPEELCLPGAISDEKSLKYIKEIKKIYGN